MVPLSIGRLQLRGFGRDEANVLWHGQVHFGRTLTVGHSQYDVRIPGQC